MPIRFCNPGNLRNFATDFEKDHAKSMRKQV